MNSIADFPLFKLTDRTRRNHALEHAAIHILTKRNPGVAFSGYSTFEGVYLRGNVDIEEIAAGMKEAFEKLNIGHKKLAIHPNCGTNFAVSGGLAGLAAGLVMLGVGSNAKDRINRLSWAMMIATIVLIISRPLGPKIQEQYTTDPNLGELEIVHIAKVLDNGSKIYKITTKG